MRRKLKVYIKPRRLRKLRVEPVYRAPGFPAAKFGRAVDGGFGEVPGCESHAAFCFTSVATLAILNALDNFDKKMLCWW